MITLYCCLLFFFQLKAYAIRSSMTSPIPEDYNPVAYSAESIKNWHKNKSSWSYFIFTNFIIFPVMTIVLIIASMVYYNDLAIDNRMEKIKSCLKKNDHKTERRKWDLQNEMYLSVTFVVYVLALSISAVKFSTETEKHLDAEIKKIFSLDPKEQNVTQLRMITALPLTTFSIDLMIATAMAALGSFAGIRCVSKKMRYESAHQYINILNLVSIIITIIFLLALGLVLDGITRGLRIPLVLGITFLVISVCGHLLIILSCVAYIYKRQETTDLYLPVWRSCAYSFMFPLCFIANHLNYIIIAFIHDLYHATSVAVAYGVVILAFYGILRELSYLMKKFTDNTSNSDNSTDASRESIAVTAVNNPNNSVNNPNNSGNVFEDDCLESSCFSCCSSKVCNGFFWLIKPVLVLILIGYVVCIILLYLFLPIDTALDDATNHFISIYQTGVIFFTAVVAYFIINRPFRSSVSIFTQAQRQNNNLKMKKPFTKSEKENDIAMASAILDVLRQVGENSQAGNQLTNRRTGETSQAGNQLTNRRTGETSQAGNN